MLASTLAKIVPPIGTRLTDGHGRKAEAGLRSDDSTLRLHPNARQGSAESTLNGQGGHNAYAECDSEDDKFLYVDHRLAFANS
jgi:hypothetical protein